MVVVKRAGLDRSLLRNEYKYFMIIYFMYLVIHMHENKHEFYIIFLNQYFCCQPPSEAAHFSGHFTSFHVITFISREIKKITQPVRSQTQHSESSHSITSYYVS